ncbi:hypothetical protein Tco_0150906 [Tanacetum coccineum]
MPYPIQAQKPLVYLDFVLEGIVLRCGLRCDREYDISAVYGITHGGLGGRNSISTNTVSPLTHERQSDADANFSVIVLDKGFQKFYPMILKICSYSIFKETLHTSAKTDKTSLHTAVNMWIRNLVIRNRVGDLQLGIESYQTKINLERPNWDAADYYLKEDFRCSLSQEQFNREKDLQDQKDLSKSRKLCWRKNKEIMTKADQTENVTISRHANSKVRSKIEYTGIVPIEMELLLEQTQQGSSHEVLHGPSDAMHNLPSLSSIFQKIYVSFLTETNYTLSIDFSSSEIVDIGTSALDGNPLQDDVKIMFGDGLKKAQAQSRQASLQLAMTSNFLSLELDPASSFGAFSN